MPPSIVLYKKPTGQIEYPIVLLLKKTSYSGSVLIFILVHPVMSVSGFTGAVVSTGGVGVGVSLLLLLQEKVNNTDKSMKADRSVRVMENDVYKNECNGTIWK